MAIVARNNITVSNVNDGSITHTAYANSADGTDGFTTVYPNLNLLDGTKDFSGDWANSSSWVTDGTYKGLTVKKRTGQWGYIFKTFTIPKDGTYTFSAYVKSSGNTANIIRYGAVNSQSSQIIEKSIGNNFDWTRDSITLNLKANDKVWVGYAITTSETDSILWNAGHKWEEGSIATPYMLSASEVTTDDYPSYRGEYSDFTSTASTDPAKYAPWTVFKGIDGVGIQTTTITYSQSTSGTTAPSTGWTSTIPTLVKGQYLWTKTVWTYTDNSSETGYSVTYISKDGTDGDDGLPGKDGTGIKTTTITYASSTSGTTAPSTGWTSSVPTVPAGSYLWTKTVWAYTDNTSETGYSVAMMGVKGQPGANAPTITNVQDQIYLSTSNTVQSGGSWGTLTPTWSSGKYYWSRVATTFSNGTTTYSTPVLDEALNQTAANQIKVTQLTQDLDGFKTTVSNTYLSKSDASGTYADKVSVASQINQSATQVTQNIQGWTNGQLNSYSTIQSTDSSIASAVADKADKSQITQLSNQITSVVESSSQNNLIYNSTLQSGSDGWTFDNVFTQSSDININGNYIINFSLESNPSNNWYFATSKQVPIGLYKTYSYRVNLMRRTDIPNSGNFAVGIYGFDVNGTRVEFKTIYTDSYLTDDSWFNYSDSYTFTNPDVKTVCFVLATDGCGHYIACQPILVNDSKVGSFVPDGMDKSQITQLSNNINLKVSKGDVTSQINLESGRVLIDSKQLLLNADNVKFSGSAFIPNAMIQSITAEKITAGTLNAANVNVINLNADSLTAGTITGIDVRSSTFYGSSTLGDMQLNSNNLRFSKSDNIFTIDYSGITNVNTNYGTRNINFHSEGIEIKSGNNNTGVFKNSGLILDGAESYIDFRSDTGTARIWKTNTNKLLMITNSGGDIKIQAGNIDFSGSNLLNTANIVTTQDNINKVKSLLIGDGATNVVGSTGRYLILDTNKGTFGMGGMWQSDRKLKKNIKKAKGSALDILDKIGVKQFDWKEGGSHVEYGLIAQEVESALPQAVFEVEQDDGSFIKQIEATGIIPILIKSIHELKSELENIKNNINFKEK